VSFELTLLALSTIVALVYLSCQSLIYKAQVGNALTVGARDEMPKAERLAGRAERAFRNFLETYPVFVALVAVVELGHASNTWTL